MNRLSNSPYTPDLRGFIAYLEAEHPEQVVRISKRGRSEVRRLGHP